MPNYIHAVRSCRRGEELLRRLCNVDAAKPAVDLEEAGLVARLMGLLLGGERRPTAETPAATAVVPPAAAPAAADAAAATPPAGAPLATRIMSLLVKSVAAANSFPDNAAAISLCLYGSSSGVSGSSSSLGPTTPRLRQLGMEFTVWVFKHAADWQLKALAPPALRRLLGAAYGGGAEATAGAAGEGGVCGTVCARGAPACRAGCW